MKTINFNMLEYIRTFNDAETPAKIKQKGKQIFLVSERLAKHYKTCSTTSPVVLE